jgi:site-specific DNA-methyltransferase (adenine-specific)
MTEYLPPSMGWIVWRKDRGNFSSSDAELAFTSFERALREYTKNPLVLAREGGTIHPTQKPICLYKWLLDKYAKENDKILDTHLGSGSIAIACHDYGFELTACELDKEYYDKAIQRIVNHTNQTKLF